MRPAAKDSTNAATFPYTRSSLYSVMKQVTVVIVLLFLLVCDSPAAIAPLSSPAEIPVRSTVNFEGYPNYTIANTLFQSQGFTFTRDDGANIYLLDWSMLGRATTSPSNVLATVRDVFDPSFATHLNIVPAVPLYAIGAHFGNDQFIWDFAKIRLSVYGTDGNLIGAVEVPVNNNTDVDQFIGIRSDIPFTHVRCENLDASGAPTDGLSVVIDDLVSTTTPIVDDSDGDGVPDARDLCPDTATGDAVDVHGCSISQLVPCAGPRSGGAWKNHGEYVSTFTKIAETFVSAGQITSAEKARITSIAAGSNCGKK